MKSLDLFGLVARDEATPDRDVDSLVEFVEPNGLFQLFAAQNYLESFLECLVDSGTQKALRKHLREPVLKDVFMSCRNWQLRMQDIFTAIAEIQQRTIGMTFVTFEDDATIVKAVLYNLEFEDEEINALLRSFTQKEPC